jgi:hypothetical protein
MLPGDKPGGSFYSGRSGRQTKIRRPGDDEAAKQIEDWETRGRQGDDEVAMIIAGTSSAVSPGRASCLIDRYDIA